MTNEQRSEFWAEVKNLEKYYGEDFSDKVRLYEYPDEGPSFLLGVPDDFEIKVRAIFDRLR